MWESLTGLDDVVALTERKNTDLPRCGAALLDDPGRRAGLVSLLCSDDRPLNADEVLALIPPVPIRP